MVKTSSITTSLIKRQATHSWNVADERTTLDEQYVSSAHYMLTVSLSVKLTSPNSGAAVIDPSMSLRWSVQNV